MDRKNQKSAFILLESLTTLSIFTTIFIFFTIFYLHSSKNIQKLEKIIIEKIERNYEEKEKSNIKH